MTPPPAGSRSVMERVLPWMLLVIGLIAGYWYGRSTCPKVDAVSGLGNCMTKDSTQVVLRNVSVDQCSAECPTCIWVRR